MQPTAQDVEAGKGLSFPAELPVLTFVAPDTMDLLPDAVRAFLDDPA